MDLPPLIIQVAFVLVFLTMVWRYLDKRGQLELELLAIFGTTTAVVVSSLASAFVPAVSPVVSPLAVVVLLAQPYLVIRLIDHVRALPRRVPAIVFVGFIATAAGSVALGPRHVLELAAIVAYFSVVEAAAAIRMFRDANRRIGLPRFRLRLAALATVLWAFAILLSGARGATGANQSPLAVELLALSRLAALVAALGYLTAFAPPRWLRRLGQRSIAFDVARSLVADPGAPNPGSPWHALADAAAQILAASRVTIARAEDSTVLATSGDPEHAPPDQAGAGVSRIEVPITVDQRRVAELRATIEGRPLFVEDDVSLLEILGLLTARAVERDEALVRLGEANRALAAAEVVRASEARFRALLEADPNAVLAIDRDGRIGWATQMAGELFGCESTELIGRPFGELVAGEAAELTLVSRRDRGVWRGESQGRRADGTVFPAELAVAEVEIDSDLSHIVVMSDVTWRREANELRDRFLGVLSHELRTPVTSIFAGSQLLLSRADRLGAAVREEVLVGIAAEADRLSRMVENLLVLAHVEHGSELLETRPLLISRVVPDLVENEQRLWPGVTIGTTVARDVPLVDADQESIAHVLRNLLSNAAKYGGIGGRIEVTVNREDDGVAVRVLDDGPGVADDADRLFDLYYRSPRTAASASGAGIGLFACREIVRAMGGRIWARSRPGGGAEFGFSVPEFVEDFPLEFAPEVVPDGASQLAPKAVHMVAGDVAPGAGSGLALAPEDVSLAS